MAVTQKIDVTCEVGWERNDKQAVGSNASGLTYSDSGKSSYKRSLENGTAATLADRKYFKQHTIAGGANLDLDLTALVESVFGDSATITLAKVKVIQIVNLNDVDGDDLNVGGGTNPFVGHLSGTTPVVKCPAGSALLITNRRVGWSVTNSSNDILRISNPGSNAITVDVFIGGTSA